MGDAAKRRPGSDRANRRCARVKPKRRSNQLNRTLGREKLGMPAGSDERNVTGKQSNRIAAFRLRRPGTLLAWSAPFEHSDARNIANAKGRISSSCACSELCISSQWPRSGPLARR